MSLLLLLPLQLNFTKILKLQFFLSQLYYRHNFISQKVFVKQFFVIFLLSSIFFCYKISFASHFLVTFCFWHKKLLLIIFFPHKFLFNQKDNFFHKKSNAKHFCHMFFVKKKSVTENVLQLNFFFFLFVTCLVLKFCFKLSSTVITVTIVPTPPTFPTVT